MEYIVSGPFTFTGEEIHLQLGNLLVGYQVMAQTRLVCGVKTGTPAKDNSHNNYTFCYVLKYMYMKYE